MTTLLEVKNLRKSYGRRAVLDDVTFSASAGELVAVLGENGAGKSTLLSILGGVLRPDSGVVRVHGRHAVCPQEPVLYSNLTPDEHFTLFGAAARIPRDDLRARAERLLDTFGFTLHRKTPVAALSGGTRQKLNLSLALLGDPPVLLLDEPYNGFDVETYHRFLDWARHARDEGRCIIVVTHIAFDRERFDRLLTLRDGHVH
jgi:ABC-2 type transport system ATP-binding protein